MKHARCMLKGKSMPRVYSKKAEISATSINVCHLQAPYTAFEKRDPKRSWSWRIRRKEALRKNKREYHHDDRHVKLKNQILQQEPTL